MPIMRLPLYEGVDWNVCWVHTGGRWTCLPLYEGVDWNNSLRSFFLSPSVSLFTREWIEIIPFVLFFFHRLSPSLRGSGLKCCIGMALWLEREVSLFTREWIEMALYSVWLTLLLSPSLRGSGLKFTPSPDGRKSRLSPSLRGSGLKLNDGDCL